MSRSGYVEGCDLGNWSYICHRGAVTKSMRGKRGQAFLKELLKYMDEMRDKKLVDCSDTFSFEIDGDFCALGLVANKRDLDVSSLNPENAHLVAEKFGISETMCREIMYMNDEHPWKHNEKDFERWLRVREWVQSEIIKGDK